MAENDPTNDTAPAARAIVHARLAEMSVGERAEQLRAVTLAANRNALAGLRTRHPAATEGELLLELARLRLGPDLVRRVYGDG
jgi:hypothetical protein